MNQQHHTLPFSITDRFHFNSYLVGRAALLACKLYLTK